MSGAAFYHVAFAVADLEPAMATFSATVGVQWHEPQRATVRDWSLPARREGSTSVT